MLFKAGNYANPTTAAPVKVATGTSIKTLMQLKPPTGVNLIVVEWGISFDGSAAATPGVVELIEVDVAATVTAYVAADITKWDEPLDAAADSALLTLGTTASGFTSTGEGTVAALRDFDSQLIAPTNQYVKQFPLGRQPRVQPGKFLRVRVTFPVTVNALCYVIFGPAGA